jgi:gluconolactonase
MAVRWHVKGGHKRPFLQAKDYAGGRLARGGPQGAWPSPHGGRLVVGAGGYQRFDSLALDAEGRICVATLVNGGITVISLDGRNVEHYPLPDPITTNICFGGPDLRTALVTLSWTGRRVALDWPVPGLRLNQ